jgi:hypothetical protein
MTVILAPHPGAYLTEAQAQRIECLRSVLDLVAGRSVPIQVVERLTLWCFDGRELR